MNQETAQGVVYRYRDHNLEFLILKRVPEDGGFWQAVTGTIENGESAQETLLRELKEEAGIANPMHVSQRLEEYHWENQETRLIGRDQVYGVEVSEETLIHTDPKEHSEFRWLSVDQAVEALKYEGNKKSIKLVAEYAEKRRSARQI